ncbi:MAG TPA: copper resistance protein CopC [Miltoncostaeaceae bacterium]|nr:copper resistance protein CopC [Miltoncostaeaceae bacterium]
MRSLLLTIVLAVALCAAAGQAFGHAYVVSSSPQASALLPDGPAAVTVTFNEPVQLLRDADLSVVDRTGASAAAGEGRVTADRRVIEIPLRLRLAPGTYTVRFQVIGADSHVIPGAFTFGVGVERLEPPYLGDGGGGPSETGPWAISARFAEVVTLGGLLGLLVFRLMVWAPAWRDAGAVPAGERERLLAWWRDAHWTLFGVLALAAMVAQGYLLVVHGASVLGVGVWTAATDAQGLREVLGQTDFGTNIQVRGALLFVLFVVGAFQFMREYGTGRTPRPASAAGGRVVGSLMILLVLSVIAGVSAQGHARVTSHPVPQIAAHTIHIAAGAVWIGALVLMVVLAARLSRVGNDAGRLIGGRCLVRLSTLATVAVGVVVLTGVMRSLGELSDLAELWRTAYGHSILIKVGLLGVLGGLALYNRRIVAAVRLIDAPNRATLALVRRTIAVEVAIALVIVLVAAVLVAQVPGR